MATTLFSHIQDVVSFPMLVDTLRLGSLEQFQMGLFARRFQVPKGTYQPEFSNVPSPTTTAAVGSETSTPVAEVLTPANVHCAAAIYECSFEVTELMELTNANKEQHLKFLIDSLTSQMATRRTREAQEALRGYAVTGIGQDTGAAATQNGAVVFTSETNNNLTQFSDVGASGGTQQTLNAAQIELLTVHAINNYGLRPLTLQGAKGSVPTGKLAFLGSMYLEWQLLTGTTTTYPFYRQYGGDRKYAEFALGEMPHSVFYHISPCEIISGGVATTNKGGLKFDQSNSYHEFFLIGQDALQNPVWAEPQLVIDQHAEKAEKLTTYTLKAYENFIKRTGRAFSYGLTDSIHGVVA